ncbi:DUF47 family protein [Mucilaginibacter sp. Bleaf8]|uniref:DUF47 domain-containing protein n=1 Tax=Mucilaginibacter sp. Bleaf8 TaxID=2834430 RepID=UPI001BD0DA08|nr:DUF47 family protein [Mucilaginibacter sp. Bleaf8]MBS7564631.1 DUF47 family protein [Mucilaginibacter sp. Bleaf8]
MKTSFFGQMLPDNNQMFYGLFNKAATTSTHMAKLLHEAVSKNMVLGQNTYFSQISRYKNEAAELKRQVYAVSGKSLISPFERNDMYALVTALSNVSDYIDISARRINLYTIDNITTPIKDFCEVIVEASHELERCVRSLHNLRDAETITQSCNHIKQLEHNADNIYDKAVASLNAEETDIFQLIKYGEIYAALERTTDKFEDVAYIIESILVKNS